MMQSFYDSYEHSPSGFDDMIIEKVLQTHMPEDSQIESSPLVVLIESIILCMNKSSVQPPNISRRLSCAEAGQDNEQQVTRTLTTNIELGRTIHHLSCEMLHYNTLDRSLDQTTFVVLELLTKHQWGTKLAIVLAAVASSYAKYLLLLKFHPINSLASSLATIKGLRKWNSINDTPTFNHWHKAFKHILSKMVSITKCVIEFEILPDSYVTLDYEAMAMMKTEVHIASYWVVRSSVGCASRINSFITSTFKMTNATAAVWELWSSARKISKIDRCLRKKLNALNQNLEMKIYPTLLNLFKEEHLDNQKVLHALLALKDNSPLKDCCSNKKVGVDVLKDKVALLLIISMGIDLEMLLLISQQLENNSTSNSKKLHEVIWAPIGFSAEVEQQVHNQVTHLFPWYSLYEPSKVSPSVIRFMQEVWHFHGDPLMVALDSTGKILSTNAIDMISIWGVKAYPFSLSRERELWEEQDWNIKLLLDDIDPLLSYWMEDKRLICLYGSNNLEWVQQLVKKLKNIAEVGVQLELIHVGCNCDEQSRGIVKNVIEKNSSRCLSPSNISIFWLRLKSMKNSKMRLGATVESDFILREVNWLLSRRSRGNGWILLGEGLSNELFKQEGDEALETLSQIQVWGKRVKALGLLNAIRRSLDPPLTKVPCSYYSITPFTENENGVVELCEKCMNPMKKHIMYQCVTR